MAEPALLLLLLLLWQSVWALDVPLEGESVTQSFFHLSFVSSCHSSSLFISLPAVRQPPTIIKQSMKEHIVNAKDTMVIECEAKGNPHPM